MKKALRTALGVCVCAYAIRNDGDLVVCGVNMKRTR